LAVAVRGELDLFSAPALERHVRALLADGHTALVVDLCETEFMDSSGIGALVNSMRATQRAGGELSVRCPAGTLTRVFEITGLSDLLRVHQPS
jgi:anti-sigma B factor antagonist